jgi:hypothetical protein
MVDSSIQQAILNELGHLPVPKQKQVLDYAVALRGARPKGTPGMELLKFAGTISNEDAKEMIEAIEAGCEQIDESEW